MINCIFNVYAYSQTTPMDLKQLEDLVPFYIVSEDGKFQCGPFSVCDISKELKFQFSKDYRRVLVGFYNKDIQSFGSMQALLILSSHSYMERIRYKGFIDKILEYVYDSTKIQVSTSWSK